MNIFFIGIFIITILLLFLVISFNNLIKAKNLVKEAFSTMDVYLKKRWDLIPNLVETVKGYAKHEQDTLDKVISSRSALYDVMSKEEKINSERQISQDISRIMAISENYPDLKASANFINLSKELSQIETDIANSRKYYNGTIRNYNNKVQTFPSNIVAFLFGFKSEGMFSISTEEKENVKVEF